MEPSTFINQTRLSQKQLQLHQQQRYYLENHNRYQQQNVHVPPIPHFSPPPQYPSPQQQFQNFQEIHQHPIPAQRCQPSPQKYHQDANHVNVCMEYENQNNQNNRVVAPAVKWNRNNILATMEKYEPCVPHPSHKRERPHRPHLNEIHQDYAYAYYEPGMPMRHQNIPGYYERASSSKPAPPNSMRALMSTTRKNVNGRNGVKYGYAGNGSVVRQHENVYEEILEDNIKASNMSISQCLVEDEFRRVQTRHQRILGELNLSVEEMLMPFNDPEEHLLSKDYPTNDDEILAQIEQINGAYGFSNMSTVEMDSGFSGSNSSYHSSSRYKKTTKVPLSCVSHGPAINYHNNQTSFYGSNPSEQINDEIGMISLSSRSSSSIYDSGKKSTHNFSPSISSNSTKSSKGNFWNRNAWKKIPGFSSNTSINHTTSNDVCVKGTFDVDSFFRNRINFLELWFIMYRLGASFLEYVA